MPSHCFGRHGDLGQQGRRYVTDVVTPKLIGEVMGEEAVAHPIRTYDGFDTEPLYPTGRAELAEVGPRRGLRPVVSGCPFEEVSAERADQ